jgi:hypothetical protein
MIAPAVVTKVDCKFVYEVYQYLYNRRFSLQACTDEALAAFLLHLRAHSDCLTYEDECQIASLDITDYSVDCSTATSSPCSTVGSVTLTESTTPCVYSTAIQNPLNLTGFPYVDLQNDEVFHKGQLNLHVTSSCGDYDETFPVETGTVLIGSSTTTSTDYDFAITARHELGNVTSLNTSYIKTIRLYQTDSTGNLVPSPIDIDVSPTTSPYLSCGSCTPVTASHLYFSHADFKTALDTVIHNAVGVLCGDSDAISLKVDTLNTTGYSVITRTKHNPAGVHFGIKHNDARLVWRNGLIGSDVVQTTINKTFQNAAIYYTNTINDFCSPLTLTMPNRFYGLWVNWGATDFHKITLGSPYSTQYGILSSPHSVTCTLYTATATVDPTPASQSWTDDMDIEVSTDLSYSTFEGGTFNFSAVFEDGCTTGSSSITLG